MNEKDPNIPETSVSQRRRLSAIMFTDIKGFSSLMESDEATAVGLVKAQREIVRKYIAIHDGEERETIGDAFLVIFNSAVNAVKCAIDIQREIWEFNQTKTPDKQVWIRIGIHLGDILVEEGSVFGEGVNLAARVEPLADPGGVCITRQVFEQVKHHIDIRVTHLSVKELKNITDVPDIYRIRVSSTAPMAPLSWKEQILALFDSREKIAAAIAATLLVIAGNVYWQFFTAHTFYARELAFIHSMPQARFPISKGEANELDHYYKITQKSDAIVRTEGVTKPKILPEAAVAAWDFGLAKRPKKEFPIHEYVYDKKKIKEELVFDEFGIFKYKLAYEQGGAVATVHDKSGFLQTFENQIAGFNNEFDKKGRTVLFENRNAFGMLKNDRDGVASYGYVFDSNDLPIEISNYDAHGNLTENKNGIVITQITYGKNGIPQKEVFLDRYKSVHESIAGTASIERKFDNFGRIALESYFDRAGQPALNREGACAKKFSYNSKGRPTEITTLSCQGSPRATQNGYATKKFEYEDGSLRKESFFDEKGTPTTNSRGVASIVITYIGDNDDDDRIEEISFFDTEGKPATDEDHAHAIRFSYDDMGRPTRRLYIGLDGKPTIASAGFAEVRVQYSRQNEPSEWAYFDAEGNLVNMREGYAVVKNEYDQYGSLTSKTFFDKRGQPTMGRGNMCHSITMKYDDRGNLDESRCLDGENKLTPGLNHCAIAKYDYDEFSKMTRYECYVDEGKLIDEPDLPSVLVNKYDDRGYLSEVTAYDANEELAERNQGAAIWKRISDDFGNQLEIATYDRNGKPINNPKYKAAFFRREYSDRGLELRAQAFDESNQPTTGIWGFAEIRYQYDDRGHQISEAYFDGKGEPTTNWQGVHEYKTSYDASGRVAEISYMGNDGGPVKNTEGVSAARNTYDQWGYVAKVDYLGTDGNPARNLKIGAASQENKYDDHGNILEIKRFDTDGKLCTNKGCIAITKQDFDPKGRLVQQIFKNAEGKPATDDNGSYGYNNEYDIQGRISVQNVLGPNNKESEDKDGVNEYHLYYRLETNKVWFVRFIDRDEKPMRSRSGADLRITLYDPVYMERVRARVDATLQGEVVLIKCLDESVNETGKKDCTNPAEIKTEVEKIKKVIPPGE